MSDIKPIPTRYKGYHFRSRLEARWAVFFDALGIRWEYEPEGFDLPSGPYLPDFRLYGLGGDGDGYPHVWFEVKSEVDDSDDPRWAELAVDTPVLVAFGMPAATADSVWNSPRNHGWIEYFQGYDAEVETAGWDSHRTFCVCPKCGRVGIAFSGYGDRICGSRCRASEINTDDDPRILRAYAAARSARFEYGQSGAT